MAVNRVIQQHFSMNYSYMERPPTVRYSKSCYPSPDVAIAEVSYACLLILGACTVFFDKKKVNERRWGGGGGGELDFLVSSSFFHMSIRKKKTFLSAAVFFAN